MIIDALVGVGPAFPWFWDSIFGDSFAILYAFEDSHSLMRAVIWCILSGVVD